MKYVLYQAQLNPQNPNDNPEKYQWKRYLSPFGDLESVEKGWEAGYYAAVAEVEANDLEHVFEIANIQHEKLNKLSPLVYSLSVNDVVKDEDGQFWVVAGMGFEKLNVEKK